ncbi:hypothetical protein NGRA_1253 [Nosema granulosis]|uniref:GIT Spa2 homology (SHD) domain-containing protein n=1 Tax=Nosema granulosis TaxID=83296 RepID=A0A9P6H0F0_9MICR|nr:hypothetical protein NGRA_1253 [Nosema granulosis]
MRMDNTGKISSAPRVYQDSSVDRNSEMSEEMDKDVVKYTLQSYIGSYTGSSNEEKKQAAVEKMENLPNGNFDELVGDVINEIHRRSGMAYDNRDKPMRVKLVKLRDDKFKNLAVDVLHVFNNRYFKNSKSDIKDEISNLGKLISILKVEEENGEEIIKETNEKMKFKLFVEYIKRFHNDKIVEHMESFINEAIELDLNNSFDILFNYKIFLKKIDNSKYKNLEEYKIYKSNIQRIEKMNLDTKTKKEMIKKEYLNISDLLVEKQFFSEETRIRDDVNYLINLLRRYSDNEKESASSLNSIHSNIINLTNRIADKAFYISYINKNTVRKLRDIADKNLEISTSKISFDEFVLEISKTIRTLLENIKS